MGARDAIHNLAAAPVGTPGGALSVEIIIGAVVLNRRTSSGEITVCGPRVVRTPITEATAPAPAPIAAPSPPAATAPMAAPTPVVVLTAATSRPTAVLPGILHQLGAQLGHAAHRPGLPRSTRRRVEKCLLWTRPAFSGFRNTAIQHLAAAGDYKALDDDRLHQRSGKTVALLVMIAGNGFVCSNRKPSAGRDGQLGRSRRSIIRSRAIRVGPRRLRRPTLGALRSVLKPAPSSILGWRGLLGQQSGGAKSKQRAPASRISAFIVINLTQRSWCRFFANCWVSFVFIMSLDQDGPLVQESQWWLSFSHWIPKAA